MSRSRPRAAAVAALMVACAGWGHAAGAADASDATERLLLFSGVELSRTWSFLHGGFVWSPDGLNAEGLALKVLSGGGAYRYRSGAEEITGHMSLTSVLPGWRFKQPGFEATAFAGLDLQAHRFQPSDPGNPLAGAHVGVRFAGESWWEPSPQTMAQAWATWSSVGTSYAARAAFGWRPLQLLYVGPEAQVLGDGAYREYRLGAHATAWRAGPWEWSAAVGYARDNSQRAGAYMRVGVIVRE